MNDITMPDFGIDWAELWTKAQTTGLEFLLQALAALLIFLVGRWVAQLITSTLHRLMQAQEVDKILETFVANFAYWVMMVFVIIATISQVGVQTTSLIAIIGAAGLAVGLALQGSLANFAAGVLIVLFRPYRVGDYVEAAGTAGIVVEVQILTTILRATDNKQIIVPNGQIMSNIITNYSTNPTRRIDLVIGVSYSDDIEKVKNTLSDLVNADDRILTDPECLIAVSQLADSSVNLVVRPWVNTDDYWAVKFELTEAIKKRFDKEGISIPFPQRDVHLHQVKT